MAFQVDPRELAWAAGLFEGEGCITTRDNGKSGKRYARLTLNMTDEDSVRRFFRAVGVGNVTLYNPPAIQKSGRKMQWGWRTGRHEHVQHVLAVLWFGLGTRRRERAAEMLQGCAEPSNRHYRKDR